MPAPNNQKVQNHKIHIFFFLSIPIDEIKSYQWTPKAYVTAYAILSVHTDKQYGIINQAPNFTYPSQISIYESTQNPLPQQKIKKTNKNTKI